jgi:hypothetical protein
MCESDNDYVLLNENTDSTIYFSYGVQSSRKLKGGEYSTPVFYFIVWLVMVIHEGKLIGRFYSNSTIVTIKDGCKHRNDNQILLQIYSSYLTISSI